MKIANGKSISSDTLALRMNPKPPERRGSKEFGISSFPRTLLYLEASESVVRYLFFLLFLPYLFCPQLCLKNRSVVSLMK